MKKIKDPFKIRRSFIDLSGIGELISYVVMIAVGIVIVHYEPAILTLIRW